MSQFERGGQNVQRWPAEFGDTDNPEGTVGEEVRDEERFSDEQRERLAQLPEHERDLQRTDSTSTVADDDPPAGGLPAADSSEDL
jgi:hypothetical protein